MMRNLKLGLYMTAELILTLCVHPRLRAWILRLLGASVGQNVRIYECRLFNLSAGFSNLVIGNNVHIGTGCLIDLQGPVRIGDRTTISPRVLILSHTDPGAAHDSIWCARFQVEANGVTIGEDCWIGASATILSGTLIGAGVAVGAGGLAKGELSRPGIYVGIPARWYSDGKDSNG